MLHALAYPGGIWRLSSPEVVLGKKEREPDFMPMKATSHVTIGSRSVCPDAAQCRKRTRCSSVVCFLALLCVCERERESECACATVYSIIYM